jgi:hypothetical protein
MTGARGKQRGQEIEYLLKRRTFLGTRFLSFPSQVPDLLTVQTTRNIDPTKMKICLINSSYEGVNSPFEKV